MRTALKPIVFAQLSLLLASSFGQARPELLSDVETAEQILEELQTLDIAIDQLAIETNLRAGDKVKVEEVRKYLKLGTRLWLTLGDPTGPKDLLGNPYTLSFIVDEIPRVSAATVKALEGVVEKGYWKAYTPKAKPDGQ
jgi:hypothetical protein